MCTDMLDAIMEGYPKTKKALIADIGLETDEEVGFNVTLKRWNVMYIRNFKLI